MSLVVAHLLRLDFSMQITAWVDEGLDHRSYIVPGLGDFGDR